MIITVSPMVYGMWQGGCWRVKAIAMTITELPLYCATYTPHFMLFYFFRLKNHRWCRHRICEKSPRCHHPDSLLFVRLCPPWPSNLYGGLDSEMHQELPPRLVNVYTRVGKQKFHPDCRQFGQISQIVGRVQRELQQLVLDQGSWRSRFVWKLIWCWNMSW